MGRAYRLAVRIGLASVPLAGIVDSVHRQVTALVDPMNAAILLHQNVGEDDLVRIVERLPEERIVLGIDPLNDAEHAPFGVNGAGYALDISDIGNVVSDHAFTFEHGRRRLAAHGWVGARKIGEAAFRPAYAEHQHVFGQPAFLRGLPDGKAHGELLESDGVAAILCVGAIDRILVEINENTALVEIFADLALVDFSLRMDKTVKHIQLPGLAAPDKLVIPRPVEQILVMHHIARVGNLDTGNRENRICRTKTIERDVHLPARHDALQDLMYLGISSLAFFCVYGRTEALPRRKENGGVLFITPLIAECVKVIGMTGDCQTSLFSIRQCRLPDIVHRLGGIVVDIYG